MDVIEHVKAIEDALHTLNKEGHIREVDEYAAMDDLISSVHNLRKVFEQNIKAHGNDQPSGDTAGEIIEQSIE